MPATPGGWVHDVLAFWFGELTSKHWFKADDQAAVDALVVHRFRPLYDALQSGPDPDPAPLDTDEYLARILVFDQFPRNMFRGTPQAFATDARALTLARAASAAARDLALPPDRRLFVYLPFEHSERMADQERSVALISGLGDAELTRYAERHREIIARFGRFPHRNAVLGRSSTPEEVAFLSGPDSSF